MEKFDTEPGPLATDFAALRLLATVAELRSFSRAAEALGLHQSTVSYTVDRLRRVFADPLFTREGRGIRPTARCEAIVAGAEQLIDGFEALVRPAAFDPATARAEVTVSCNHYEQVLVLPGLIRHLRARAPGVRLRVIPSQASGHEQLRRGACDLLMSPLARDAAGLYVTRLLTDRYVCVTDPARPGALDMEGYLAAEHVVTGYGGGWKPLFLDMLAARGHGLAIAVDLPSSGSIAETIRGTDLVATTLSLLAGATCAGLVVRPAPFETELPIRLYWTERTHASPLHAWLRGALTEVARGLETGAG
ncbi:LysR family transcriptional regulator [Oceanicella sp. SM1341]|uniref:LysR family transcriptional regulator n=1 Tax=Oceanicella sp. SM1341 TaxID=1548889 RepID=UPI000E479D87|nr:LysR family transcriptional regulator [Oceanicella sp. SM1341]